MYRVQKAPLFLYGYLHYALRLYSLFILCIANCQCLEVKGKLSGRKSRNNRGRRPIEQMIIDAKKMQTKTIEQMNKWIEKDTSMHVHLKERMLKTIMHHAR